MLQAHYGQSCWSCVFYAEGREYNSVFDLPDDGKDQRGVEAVINCVG